MLDAHALHREIVRVHAPDTWFLKRGTTPAALRHALIGNQFAAARRIGKQIILDTADPDTRLGVHLGMSGRVIVDGEEAGDPLVYASNRRVSKWHRFGVHFVDGGSFMLRDPRRLGLDQLLSGDGPGGAVRRLQDERLRPRVRQAASGRISQRQGGLDQDRLGVSWFETRGVAALLTMRDLILRSALLRASRRMKTPHWEML